MIFWIFVIVGSIILSAVLAKKDWIYRYQSHTIVVQNRFTYCELHVNGKLQYKGGMFSTKLYGKLPSGEEVFAKLGQGLLSIRCRLRIDGKEISPTEPLTSSNTYIPPTKTPVHTPTTQSYTSDIYELKRRAYDGDTEAMFKLSTALLGTRDEDSAFDWLVKAAELGHSAARHEAGEIYFETYLKTGNISALRASANFGNKDALQNIQR
ncbi:MAG: hypothetical protein FWG65_01125 [Turicibacter sp.]|nr:hypothetical protein [Turicibacter sp.]